MRSYCTITSTWILCLSYPLLVHSLSGLYGKFVVNVLVFIFLNYFGKWTLFLIVKVKFNWLEKHSPSTPEKVDTFWVDILPENVLDGTLYLWMLLCLVIWKKWNWNFSAYITWVSRIMRENAEFQYKPILNLIEPPK